MDRTKWVRALKFGNCWLCGEIVGRHRTFVLGPMCAVNRTTSEPPNHLECAEFAVRACPFLTLPAAQYRGAKLLDEEGVCDGIAAPRYQLPPGKMSTRNPGAACLWTTQHWRVFNVDADIPGAVPGQLIHVGEPSDVTWWALGQRASRDQVEESIAGGFPALLEMAERDGANAVAELHAMRAKFSVLLPP